VVKRFALCATVLAAATSVVVARTQEGQGPWRAVNLVLPVGIAAEAVSACVADTGAPVIRPYANLPGAFQAQCALTGSARCSIPGTEPRDLDLVALCQGERATLVAATRLFMPIVSSPGAVMIEWRTWQDQLSSVLAMRPFDPGVPRAVPMAAEARLMRVHHVGGSPVTFAVESSEPGTADPVFVGLPVPAAGGELFLVLGEREQQASSVLVEGPEIRVVGTQGSRFVSIPGLAPGTYTLRFGPLEMPVGSSLEFVIQDRATTEVVPQLPPMIDEFRISGSVSYNGRLLASQTLDVVFLADDSTVTTTTDERGRYSLTVSEGGDYLVRVESAYDFGLAEAQSTVARGETRIDLDISGASVQLTFLLDGAVPDDAVEFVIEGQERFRGIASDFSTPTELFAIPFGTYTVRASMAPAFVSNAIPIDLVETGSAHTLTVDITHQSATLRVVDATGSSVVGARALAGTQIVRALIPGELDVTRVSPGTELLVRVRGYTPACVVLQPNIENIVVLNANIASLQIHYDVPPLRLPPGHVRFRESDRCVVPLSEFEWTRIEAGFEIQNLPKDVQVIYEYGTARLFLKAPGEAVVIR